MTPLEQFNEEVMKAIDYNSHDMGEMGKFIRVEYAKNIITQKLTEHKELILKMVREKAPKLRIVGYQTYCLTCNGHLAAGECDCVGFNQGVQEFLNNLDTI